MRVVIALGGNALLHRYEQPDAATQEARLAAVAPALARLAAANQVLFVHGNGPQVGLLARESAEDRLLTAAYPLGLLSSATQGIIGSMLQQTLRNAGLTSPIATLVTHTVVDPGDPSLQNPEKFIGPLYSRRRAYDLSRANHWTFAADNHGWRRVVASPLPREILELETGRRLIEAGTTTIMGGGGGVPVVMEAGSLRLVEAVVDKDHTAALLARCFNMDLLAILTDVPGVMTDYGTPEATVLSDLTPALARDLRLPQGSMGPKVAAACEFVSTTGRPAVIGPLDHAEDVIAGIVGTRIRPGSVAPTS